jgi:hypothetical protein
MIGFYTLDREGIVSKATEAEAQEFASDEDRCNVALHKAKDGTMVSTAFIPICLMFEDGSPQCFETIIVRDCKSRTMRRYSTFLDALNGHDALVNGLEDKSPA